MVVPLDALVGEASRTFWAMLRIGGFFMVVPVVGSQMVSPRIRIALTFATALAVTPLVPSMPPLADIDLSVLLLAVTQVLIGVGLGFTTIVLFQIFTIAGQFIAMQMGLGFASMVDPANGISVTVISQFFLMLVSLTFVAMDGHLVLLSVLVEGFLRTPLGIDGGIPQLSWQIASLGTWMFGGAVLIALPAVTSLLVVNLAFGVMTRAAPQLNVFSLGFPFALLFGLVIIWVALYEFTPQFEGLTQWYFEWTRRWG
jgi:flagellar biosynthesis protein FliR